MGGSLTRIIRTRTRVRTKKGLPPSPPKNSKRRSKSWKKKWSKTWKKAANSSKTSSEALQIKIKAQSQLRIPCSILEVPTINHLRPRGDRCKRVRLTTVRETYV